MPHFIAPSSRPSVASARRSAWRAAATLAALAALALAGPAFALPPANADRGGDPAPKPLLSRPVPAPAAAALPDTSALLPAGDYVLRLTLKGETLAQPVKLGRSGGSVNATVGDGAMLSGTLDATGRLQLAGGNSTDRLELGALVANRRASGQAQLGRGASRMNGSFTLDPVVQGARKLAEFGAPKPKAGGDGFFERIGKAWSCLTNWSSC